MQIFYGYTQKQWIWCCYNWTHLSNPIGNYYLVFLMIYFINFRQGLISGRLSYKGRKSGDIIYQYLLFLHGFIIYYLLYVWKSNKGHPVHRPIDHHLWYSSFLIIWSSPRFGDKWSNHLSNHSLYRNPDIDFEG